MNEIEDPPNEIDEYERALFDVIGDIVDRLCKAKQCGDAYTIQIEWTRRPERTGVEIITWRPGDSSRDGGKEV